jgi:Actinobacteria/chloroflexi VLRF1 release factor
VTGGPAGRPAAGGGAWVAVQPERLERWLAAFAGRHGGAVCEVEAERVTVRAADGSRAECTVPFPPLRGDPAADLGGLVAHACRERTVGVLLVRLGGHAAGVFRGARLLGSKVGARPVHGRSAAGGTSQKRFARRREGQAAVALDAAADVAARILLPALPELEAVVVGGDRRAVDAVLADPRLGALRALVSGSLLDVPDPRQRVLESTPRLFRAVRIRVVEAAAPAPPV